MLSRTRAFARRWWCCLLLPGLASAQSLVPTHVWTGAASDDLFTTPANWLDAAVPASDGTAIVSFAAGAEALAVQLTGATDLDALLLGFDTGAVSFSAANATTLTLRSGLGGDAETAAALTLGSRIAVALAGAQTWDIGSASIDVLGNVTGTELTITGSGRVGLWGRNQFNTVTVQGATLALGSNTALGNALLVIEGGIIAAHAPRIVVNSTTVLTSLDVLMADPYASLTFTGTVMLATPDVRLGGASSYGSAWRINGGLAQADGVTARVTIGRGKLTVAGSSSYEGGTQVGLDDAAVNTTLLASLLVFESPGAVPSEGLITVLRDGYAGVAFLDQIDRFLSHLDPASSGTIGFDTPAGASSPLDYTGPLDFSAFDPFVSFGSDSVAVISGPLLAPEHLRFGLGRGTLYLTSVVTDRGGGNFPAVTRNVILESSATDLTVFLRGSNTYTGPTIVFAGRLIFDGVGALPVTGGALQLGDGAGAYIGHTAATGLSATQFLGRLDAGSTGGIAGFDSTTDGQPWIVTDTIDFNLVPAPVAVGTSTAAVFSGPLVADEGGQMRFASTRYGTATIASALTGTTSLVIGTTVFDPTAGTVALTGDNTFGGGTTLHGGTLSLGRSSALGTGTLTLGAGFPLLTSSAPDLVVGNAIRFPAFNGLVIDASNNLTLAGVITGTGQIDLLGLGTLTLSGENEFSGTVALQAGQLVVQTDTGLGAATTLELSDFEAVTATFTSAAPAIAGLDGGSGASTVALPSAGTTLTLQSSWEHAYAGAIAGDGRLVVTGGGSQTLAGASTYTGGTELRNGTLRAGDSAALGTGAVTLTGGTLEARAGVTLSNPLVLERGVLAGAGTYAPPAPLVVGGDVGLAPGGIALFPRLAPESPEPATPPAGALTIQADATFAGGGYLLWDLADPLGAAGTGWDLLTISGRLTIAATPDAPFTLVLGTVGASGYYEPLETFDTSAVQSWVIVQAGGGIAGFDAAAFEFNTANFLNPLGPGMFFVSQTDTGLVLNFTPVPEPSTWVLMAAGAGLIAWAARRRRA